MLYLVFSGTIKEGKQAEFYRDVAAVSQKLTHQHDKAVVYQWHKEEENPNRFFLNEQWESVADLHAHFETLYKAFGPAKPTERLPAKILAYLDEAQVNFYQAIQ
ncbi:putative quinol monooxygenase [Pseudomonas sp. W2I6]|jgi:quinol monooxygenase YgiN|uniref:putative quinol monooxygenase n=1 Tax=Pseudomonas sp. W2I6 TaxID=3042289 RepID=UPI002785A9EC|nr:antibiotic biosynthesis monooxygenase family protein [Pseudomonas sp. W2I6]MDQ0671794.1 quinol monooxygenase YgiN [Pseudomonas sp. W2I6]